VSRKFLLCAVLILGGFQLPSHAQTAPAGKEKAPPAKEENSSSPKPGTVEARVEKYLRNLYAWGPAFQIKVGPTKPSPVPDLLEIPVTVSKEGQSDTAVVYVSKTGNFLFRGELTDMSADPFADIKAKLHIGNSPTLGPADAKVTLIEFGDLECPSCRQLDLVLRDLLTKHPEVRLVFKHFPLTNIHPWAMTAAIATQCAYEQSPAYFWKLHDAIYDAQDQITPSNVWDKLQDLANQQGLNTEAYRTCEIDPATAATIKASIEEGQTLDITATPTTFINGRRIVGPDKSAIEQYIAYSNPNGNII
jgi:protein-disulfide isomerase